MPNFFRDNPDLVARFEELDLAEVVEVLEHGYRSVEEFPDAPADYAEAVDAYRTALDLVGEIAGDFIAPRSAAIDAEGAHLVDGEVVYATGTTEARQRLAEAGFMGVIIPRRYGGLNFPATVYIMMIEMVSRADASMMTLFGYQDVGEAIATFGSDEVARRFLPDYAAGRHIGAMVLTEPGAGSDLQSVRLRAFQDADGTWRLRGVKHFISNGNGDLLLVLARSEPGTSGMMGLSLFAVHADDSVIVNRVEEKMGLHGSPTCELFFDDTPATLVGKRRFGLVQVLHVLNHARFSVAAQGLGIAEAAYREALAWARERRQFGTAIYDLAPVADMLMDMEVTLQASRALVYCGSQWLDRRNKLEEKLAAAKGSQADVGDAKTRFRQAARIVDFLSPAVKYWVTEAAVSVCYDAQQLHGGMGYMREMPVERMVRDVRITTIYEGTTQVQVGASLPGALDDVLAPVLPTVPDRPELAEAAARLADLRRLYESSRELLEKSDDERFRAASARDLVDLYVELYAGHLLAAQAASDDAKIPVVDRFVTRALAAAEGRAAAIRLGRGSDVDRRDLICGP